MDKPFAITLDIGSSRANKTGAWRTERPEYVHRMPPCNDACPAGENVQAWLYEAEEGGAGYERAWRKIMEDNPFPAVMGRAVRALELLGEDPTGLAVDVQLVLEVAVRLEHLRDLGVQQGDVGCEVAVAVEPAVGVVDVVDLLLEVFK
jgi:hypothetical protein